MGDIADSIDMCNKMKKLLPEYIKGVVDHKYTLRQAAESTGYTVQGIFKLKQKFLKIGADAFIHANTGKPSHNKISKEVEKKIIQLYDTEFESKVNFSFFRECLLDYDIKISYTALHKLLREAGFKSPESHRIKHSKPVHRPRPRRLNEGDLIQIDGTPYQWFKWCGDNSYYCMMGAIDDATGKITGLYMTENECLYGYNEVYRLTIENYGVPRESYMDRSAIFCATPKNKSKLTLDEQLAGLKEHRTQFQRIMDDLHCRQILAWSPQAKGRVERMWRTLQGRLPYLFKKNRIKNMKEANIFLQNWLINDYNKSQFIKKAAKTETFWMKNPGSLENILCARFHCKTNSAGVFKFRKQNFTVIGAKYVACKDLELCINEHGLRAYLNGKYYPVEMLDFLSDGIDNGSAVLDNIMYEYLYKDMKQQSA